MIAFGSVRWLLLAALALIGLSVVAAWLSAYYVLVCHCARGGINCLAGRDCLGLGSSVNAQNASLFSVARHELDSAICIMSLD